MFWDEVRSLVLLSKEGIKGQLVSCDVCCPDGRGGRLGGVCVCKLVPQLPRIDCN